MFGKVIILTMVFFVKDGELQWILVLVSMIAFLDGWAAPVRQAMLPEFVGKQALPKANSLVSISDNIVNLASWPLGAFFVTFYGGGPLILVTIGLYSVGWLLTNGIKIIPHVKERAPSLKEQLSGGWAYSFSRRSIRSILILDTLFAFAGAVWISSILYVYVDDVLGKSEAWWGYINSFYSGGFLVGGFLFAKLIKIPAYQMIVIGCFLTSILTIWFIYPLFAVLALIISLLLGVFGQFQMLAQLTVLQTQTEIEQLGLVFSVQTVLTTGAFGVATFLFGWIAEYFGIELAFFVAAVLSLTAGIYGFIERKTLSYQLID